MTDISELYKLTARQCTRLLKQREVTPTELIEAAVARMDAVDGEINALPIRCIDRALEQAKKVDLDTPLAGLPIAVKDYNDVGGVRTTYGSPIYREYVPAASDATVTRLEQNGAIPIAKSNVPEWAGGNTFNPVLGTTRNPWNLERTAGGSSGGSAAALASGQVWLATGNDLGGSLRTPAAFNGVVGLRPSPGRVPRGERLQLFDSLWVEGPMARNVGDLALMLDAGAGFDPIDPLSFASPADCFLAAASAPQSPGRVAFSPDLNVVPMAREVATIAESAAMKFTGLGTDVTNDIPDFDGSQDAFQVLRGVLLATMMGDLLDRERKRIAPEIVGNVELGQQVTVDQIFAAERFRWQLHQRMARFFETHDLLICPAVSIPPFPVDQRYVDSIDGERLNTYIDWFAITFVLSLSACPVLSLPCGLNKDGLPVGLQLVGKPRGEESLLAFGAQLEQLLGIAETLPIEPGMANSNNP